MIKTKLFIFIAIAVAAVIGILVLVYFAFGGGSQNNDVLDDGYPLSVKTAISKPIEKVSDNYYTLVKKEDYLISYGGDLKKGTFYITVNKEPVIDVANAAEQAFLKKLNIDESYACSLNVILNIPSIIDNNLSDYDFGLSFCPDRPHIQDVSRGESGTSKYDEIRIIPASENFNASSN